MCCEMRWWLNWRSGLPVPANQPIIPQAVIKNCPCAGVSGVRSVMGEVNGWTGIRPDVTSTSSFFGIKS